MQLDFKTRAVLQIAHLQKPKHLQFETGRVHNKHESFNSPNQICTSINHQYFVFYFVYHLSHNHFTRSSKSSKNTARIWIGQLRNGFQKKASELNHWQINYPMTVVITTHLPLWFFLKVLFVWAFGHFEPLSISFRNLQKSNGLKRRS